MKRMSKILSILMVAVLLTSCKSSDYSKACKQMENGEYKQALEIFNSLDDSYKDVDAKKKECKKLIDGIAAFNDAANRVKVSNKELDKLIAKSEKLISGKDKVLDKTLKKTLTSKVAEAKEAKVKVPKASHDVEKLKKQTDKLKAVDNGKALENLKNTVAEYEKSIKQYKLVCNPKDSYIISKIQGIPGIKDYAPVTEDNDPNGKLGKKGGYTALVYFSHEGVDQSEFFDEDVIEKGTDAGGAIEVYANEKDANARNEYLAGFDGGMLSSGSHTVIGTCVIRTSDNLPASKQKELESAIISALTSVE